MELESFVFSAVLLLAATSVAVTVFRHLGLGSVLGLLIAGVAVGPHTMGPAVTTHVEDVRSFTELGVVMLLFLIGLEMKPKRLWAMRREVFGLGSLQVVATGLVIALYFHYALGAWTPALLLGLTLALSSTAFVMQLLQERGEIASRHGTATFAVLLLQDLAIVPLLAMVSLLSPRATAEAALPGWERIAVIVGAFAAVWMLGSRVIPQVLDKLARQNNREGFFMVVMLTLFLAAWLMNEAGFSMALGAFVIGLLLSDCRYNLQIQALVEPYKGLLLSLFFVAVGMSIDLEALLAQPLEFARHVTVIVLIKLVVVFALGLVFGFPRQVATRMAFLLAQGGEFGFVLLGAAKAAGILDDATFVVAIGLISITMLFTPLMVRLGDWVASRFEPRAAEDGVPRFTAEGTDTAPKVIIGGYGRVGHVVATLLHSSGIPFIVFDRDPERVRKGNQDGYRVYYGDIGDPELLAAAHVERAALVVITVDHGPTALRAVSHLRNGYPNVPVLVRARDLEASGHLLQAGATEVFPEAIESSLALAAHTLQIVGTPPDNVDQLMSDVRHRNYALVRPVGKPRVNGGT